MADTPEQHEADERKKEFTILAEQGPTDLDLLRKDIFDIQRFWRAEGAAVGLLS